MSCKNWDVLGWSKEKVEQRIDGWREGGRGWYYLGTGVGGAVRRVIQPLFRRLDGQTERRREEEEEWR